MIYQHERDPLCYPDTDVLINLAHLTNQADLDQFELAMFLSRAEEPPPQWHWTADGYLGLHRHLFQDVYSWAGTLRTIRTGKGSNWCCYPEYIAPELARVFQALESNVAIPRSPGDFAAFAAHNLAEINAIHPFREGNGRAQLVLLRLLTQENALPFSADKLDPERTIQAMIDSFGGHERPLAALIYGLVT